MIKYRNWFPAAVVMITIFLLSSVSGYTIQNAGLGKESYHINGHFWLFMLLCFAYYKATKSILKSVFLTIFYGLFDEIHQKFTPLRSSSLFDIYVNTFGASISGFILWKLQQFLPKKLKNWLNE